MLNIFIDMKKIATVLVLVLVAGFLIWAGTTKDKSLAPIVAEFSNAQTGESISVTFDNVADTATMTGAGHTGLVFTHAISASGARYVNEEENLVLWNKGNEITLYENDQPVFVGITTQSFE